MRPLSPQFKPYGWALSTAEIAARAGIAPEDVLRFDGNTAPDPPPTARPETIADALERIQSYRHGGFPGAPARDCGLQRARAGERRARLGRRRPPDALRAGVRRAGRSGRDRGRAVLPALPRRRVGDGSGRRRRRPGADVRVPAAQPDRGDGRPPAGAAARRRRGVLRIRGRDRAPLLGSNDVVVVRTFSKAFRLASARVGYALAESRSRGAERASGSLRRSRRSPPHSRLPGSKQGRPTCRRRSRSASAWPPGCGRSGSRRCRRTRTSCSCRTSVRRRSTRRCSGRVSPCGRRPARSASRCTGRRPTTAARGARRPHPRGGAAEHQQVPSRRRTIPGAPTDPAGLPRPAVESPAAVSDRAGKRTAGVRARSPTPPLVSAMITRSPPARAVGEGRVSVGVVVVGSGAAGLVSVVVRVAGSAAAARLCETR